VALSGVAYCTDPIFGKDTVTNWSCNACHSFPSISNATTFHGSKSDANGYVAYDSAANEVIVSFSGTDPLSIKNWLADIDFVQQSYPLCNGCLVHKGFYQSYLSVAPTIESLVKSMLVQHPSASIAVTGHSLGAAMAAHAMADFVGYKKFGNTNVKVSYTFGMPRVGNDAFQKWYVGALPGTFRVVHQKDPVPQLPPQSFTEGNYHHMPYEVFYTSNYNNWKLCSIEGEDPSCSDQYTVALDVLMHLNYLDFDFTTNYLSCEF
jgi:predicted lipase